MFSKSARSCIANAAIALGVWALACSLALSHRGSASEDGYNNPRLTRAAGFDAAGSDFPNASNRSQYAELPLAFERNPWRSDGDFQFISAGTGGGIFLSADEALIAFRSKQSPVVAGPVECSRNRTGVAGKPALVRMRLKGSNSAAPGKVSASLSGRMNYFIGSDASKWRADVPLYGRVEFDGVYPGIDIAYYGNQARLEYDFIVSAGADADRIRLSYPEADSLRIGATGGLLIGTSAGELSMAKPTAYQWVAGLRTTVAADFQAEGCDIGFRIGPYEHGLPLIIDPVIGYSTFLGGSQDDQGIGIAVDAAGSAFVTGFTYSLDFPLSNPLQTSNPFGVAFVTKLNASGNALVYSTVIGGSDGSESAGIAIDRSGSAYITGATDSTDFPVVNAFQRANGGASDAFVTKLAPNGASLIYSTYLGGSGLDLPSGIAVDNTGAAYITGETFSQNFPTLTPIQPAKSGRSDGFVAKLAPSGASLVYSTYIGGNGTDGGNSIAVDALGNAYVAGGTTSADFPIVSGFQSRFAANTLIRTDRAGNWSPANAGLPGNVSILALAVDPTNPQTILAGTQGAGLFESTDGGSSWAPKNNGLAPVNVNAVAVDPTNHSIMYAGGFSFPPVSKSTDGGSSWQPAGTGLNNPNLTQLLIDPADHNTVFAGTRLGLYATNNGGANWVSVQSYPLGSSTPILSLTADPVSPGTFYAGTNTDLFKTTDGGKTWAEILLPYRVAIDSVLVDPSNHSTIYAGADGPEILKSTDGGTSWKLASSGLAGYSVRALEISLDSTLYAGTFGDGLFLSRDGGATWQPVSGLPFETVQALAIDSGSPSGIYAGSYQVFHGFVTKLSPSASIAYSTLLGGNSDDFARAIAVDAQGNAWVVGLTFSTTFPTADPFQDSNAGLHDAFVTKLSASGSAVLYSTYLGAGADDTLSSVAMDSAGNVYVAGDSFSTDLHVISPGQPTSGGDDDAFVARLNPTGALTYCSYTGGKYADAASSIAVDSAGNAYLTGTTLSADFPVTPGALRTTRLTQFLDQDAFVVKLSLPGSSLVITSAMIVAKQLIVFGAGFDNAATVLIDGEPQKTQNDPSDPSTKLIAKKAGRKIPPSQQVTLQVRAPSGELSPAFSFTRSP